MLSLTDHLAYTTDDAPGIGGIIKQRPEDFLVEELPLYEPTGEGEHLYLFIEKQLQTTSDVTRRLAKMFHVKRSDIGYAGLKDKRAITRQHFSIYLPNRENEQKYLERIEFTPFNLLWSDRHANKLRRGHLAGNRFVIRIRNVEATSVLRVKQVLDRLVKLGVPNYIGDQRFGYRQNNHRLGQMFLLRQWQPMLDELLGVFAENDPASTIDSRKAYLRGDYAGAIEHWPRAFRHERQALDTLRQGRPLEQAIRAIDRTQREFFLSALQSAIFNEVLSRRVKDKTFDQLLQGDLAWKHDSRSVFAVDQQTAELENSSAGRVPKLQVSPSGPMWGDDLIQPQDEPLALEKEILESYNLTPEAFAQCPMPMIGVRRSLRMSISNASVSGGVDEHGSFVRVAFDLPRGCFATMVLREIMKPCNEAPRQTIHKGNTPPPTNSELPSS
jgi:tRNA pseudouridine13 synthase